MRNACTELFDDQQRLFYKHIHVHKLILRLHAYKMNYFKTMKLANTTLLNGSVLRYRAWNMRKLGAQASRGCSSISRREQVRYASWETPTIAQSSFFFRIMNWDDIVQLSGLVTPWNLWRRRKPRLKASGNCLIIFKGKMRKVTSFCL